MTSSASATFLQREGGARGSGRGGGGGVIEGGERGGECPKTF